MNDQIIPVDFHGDALALVDHDGEPFVAMRSVTDNIGLDWASQYIKLTEKFGSVVVIITTTGGDGKQYEMVCLPLRKIPAWLYSINPNKVKPDIREKVIRYQDECDDVLWQYWTLGYAARAGFKPPSVTQQVAVHGVRLRLLKELKRETNQAVREAIHQQIDHTSRILGISSPELDTIGHTESTPPLVDIFWEAVDMIGLDKLNHARSAGTISISMPHFAREAAAVKLKLPALSEFYNVLRRSKSPHFVEIKPVNSGLYDKVVKCWVFRDLTVDFNSVDETAYLLGSSKNATRLKESIDQLKAGENRKP